MKKCDVSVEGAAELAPTSNIDVKSSQINLED